jgi:hypothetical protein
MAKRPSILVVLTDKLTTSGKETRFVKAGGLADADSMPSHEACQWRIAKRNSASSILPMRTTQQAKSTPASA